MNYQNYFDTCREQSITERNYKLSLENFKKELIYQGYCEIIDFLTYVHQQGYRKADGYPLHNYMDNPEKLKENMWHGINWKNGGSILMLDRDISAFRVIYDENDEVIVECGSGIDEKKKIFPSVESFIKRITKTVLDTFVIVDTPKETSETSEWNQMHF